MAGLERKQQLTRSVLQASDEDLPICSPCENGGSEIEAHGFCSNCKEHLCEACYTSHLRPKLFRNHVLLDKFLMPREVPPADDMCPKHPAQQLEYYCRTHDKLECSRCVNIHHRTCEDVSYIGDICDEIEKTDEFRTLYRTLKRIEHDAVQNQEKVTRNLADVQTNVDETKASIRSFRKYLDQQLDEMDKALCAGADDIFDRDKQTIENVSTECDALISNVRAMIYNLDVSGKTRQKMRVFILMKTTQRILTEWRKEMDSIASKNRIQQYTFEPNNRLQGVMRDGQQLGKLVVEDDSVMPSHPAVEVNVKTTTQDQVASRNLDFMRPFRFLLKGKGARSKHRLSAPHDLAVNTPQNITAVKYDTVSVEVQTDSSMCGITGSVHIDDKTLAVTDFNNWSVKTVDLNSKKVKDYLSLKQAPNDITRINEHNLAITCPAGAFIQLVTVRSGYLALGQQIQVDGACYGIHYIDTGGGRLVVSFTDPHKVKVMDMPGTVLNDLSSDTAGQPRFGIPFHIAISNDRRTLIMSNALTNTVTGLTLDGAVKFVYRDQELLNPRGVAVGDGGEIYVCGCASNNIHVISSDGRKVKVLLKKTDGLKTPTSVTYFNNKLFVGSKDNNTVDVYKIVYHRH